jgi:ComF family protein
MLLANIIRVIDYFKPKCCGLCQQTNPGEGLLCSSCLTSLVLPAQNTCLQCAAPLLHSDMAHPNTTTCNRCQLLSPAFDASFACYQYAYPLRRVIHAYKYEKNLTLSHLMATLCLAHLPNLPIVDAVIAVPLAKARLAYRGFNQSDILAKTVARALNKTNLSSKVGRVKATQQQARLSIEERHLNMQQAFICHGDVQGLSLLIVDDVMSSGATLHSLAATLKAAGAISVYVLVLARAYDADLSTFNETD